MGTLVRTGVTEIESSTAGRTVIAAVPERVAAESAAVMVARPVLDPAVTSPVDETAAVELAEVDQVTISVRSEVLPSEYVPVAVSCCVSPEGRFATAGETVTVRSTAGRTVITAVPDSSATESDAVIVASPVLEPAVTSPVDDTDAVELAEVDQVTVSVRFLVVPSE